MIDLVASRVFQDNVFVGLTPDSFVTLGRIGARAVEGFELVPSGSRACPAGHVVLATTATAVTSVTIAVADEKRTRRRSRSSARGGSTARPGWCCTRWSGRTRHDDVLGGMITDEHRDRDRGQADPLTDSGREGALGHRDRREPVASSSRHAPRPFAVRGARSPACYLRSAEPLVVDQGRPGACSPALLADRPAAAPLAVPYVPASSLASARSIWSSASAARPPGPRRALGRRSPRPCRRGGCHRPSRRCRRPPPASWRGPAGGARGRWR